MANQMNLILVNAMSIYAECHSAITHDFMYVVPQSDVCIFYYIRNLCLLEFQLSNEFISFCPPERQKVLKRTR